MEGGDQAGFKRFGDYPTSVPRLRGSLGDRRLNVWTCPFPRTSLPAGEGQSLRVQWLQRSWVLGQTHQVCLTPSLARAPLFPGVPLPSEACPQGVAPVSGGLAGCLKSTPVQLTGLTAGLGAGNLLDK